MADGDLEQLLAVRRELLQLVYYRDDTGLNDVEQARYDALCRTEGELVAALSDVDRSHWLYSQST